MGNSDVTRLLLRIALFVPLGVAPVLTNWIFTQPSVERRMAHKLNPTLDILAAGKPIWFSDEMRTLKQAWLARTPAAMDVLILGNSRSMQIAGTWFQPRTMFNGSVLGGDLDDVIAIFEICVETGRIPREIVLDLHPALVKKYKSEDQRPLSPHFQHALERYGFFPPTRFFADYFSMRQVQRNIRRWASPAWSYSTEAMPHAIPLLPDSSAGWEVRRENPTPAEVEANVHASLRNDMDDVRHWKSTSQPAEFDLKLLRRFLDDLQSRGIHITLLLAPIHPVAYDYYTKRGGYDETWIRQEMRSRKIPIAGSYSPKLTGAASTDFYDDIHPRAAVLRRLLTEAGVIDPTEPIPQRVEAPDLSLAVR